MPRVLVGIVTFDSARDIERCLASLELALATDPDSRILVVDNASSDDTVARIASRFPRLEIDRQAENRGFAAAANRIVERASTEGFDYIYLLNPDTEVTPAFLARAAERMRDDRVAAVQSLVCLDPDRELVDSAGNVVHFLGFGYCVAHRRPVATAGPSEGARAIGFASGAAVLLRVAALDLVGRFDESLFLYLEDLDLGWRLRLAGCEAVLAPDSIVYHRHEFARTQEKYFLLERNRWRVLLQNASWRTLIVLTPSLLAAELALAVVALAQGWLGAKARAWGDLTRPATWRRIRQRRRAVAAIRRISDRELVSTWTAELEHPLGTGRWMRRFGNPLLRLAWRVSRPWI